MAKGLFGRIGEAVGKAAESVKDWATDTAQRVFGGGSKPTQAGLSELEDRKSEVQDVGLDRIEREETELGIDEAITEYSNALTEFELAKEELRQAEDSYADQGDYYEAGGGEPDWWGDPEPQEVYQDDEAMSYIDQIMRLVVRVKTEYIDSEQQRVWIENRLSGLMDEIWNLKMSDSMEEEVFKTQELGEEAIDYLWGGRVYATDVEIFEDAPGEGKLRASFTTLPQAEGWLSDIADAASEYFVIVHSGGDSGYHIYERV